VSNLNGDLAFHNKSNFDELSSSGQVLRGLILQFELRCRSRVIPHVLIVIVFQAAYFNSLMVKQFVLVQEKSVREG